MKYLRRVLSAKRNISHHTTPTTNSQVGDFVDTTINLARNAANTNKGESSLTLRQLDCLVDLTASVIIQEDLYPSNWARALVLIDGILKPNDIDVLGGYTAARKSYILESGLPFYYECLDVGRSKYPDDILSAINYGVRLYEVEYPKRRKAQIDSAESNIGDSS